VATNVNLTTFDYALKDLYDEARTVTAICAENPAYARCKKTPKFPERKHSFMVHYGGPARSATFANAQSNRYPSKGLELQIKRGHDYCIGRIDTETMLASEDDPDRLRQAAEGEADNAILALNNSLGRAFFGSGSGALGQVNQSSLDTTTLTLKDAGDVIHFDVGQCLVFAADEASALRDTGKVLTVSKVNESAGTLVLSAKLNTVTALATLDSIFTEGDYVSAADKLLPNGLDAWIPKTAPTTTETFCNADRSVNVTKLAGHRHTSTTDPGLTTLEAIGLLARRIKRSGQSANTCYLGTDRMGKLIQELEGKALYSKESVPVHGVSGEIIAEVGFDAIVVHAGGATVKVFADRNCPETTAWVLKNEAVEFLSLGQAPRWVVTGTPVSDADQTEFRLAYWGNFQVITPCAVGRYDW